jgi:hypothetical protein
LPAYCKKISDISYHISSSGEYKVKRTLLDKLNRIYQLRDQYEEQLEDLAKQQLMIDKELISTILTKDIWSRIRDLNVIMEESYIDILNGWVQLYVLDDDIPSYSFRVHQLIVDNQPEEYRKLREKEIKVIVESKKEEQRRTLARYRESIETEIANLQQKLEKLNEDNL